MILANINNDKFLVGLFAYLVQSDRSLHRSLNSKWGDFLYVYQKNLFIPPNIVIDEMDKRFPIVDIKIEKLKKQITIYLYNQKIKNFFSRITYWINNKINFKPMEVALIKGVLKNFYGLISLSKKPDIEKIIDIRQELYLSSLIIRNKFPSILLICKKVEQVEHFNQNEHMNFMTINEIVGNKWI